MIDLYGVEDVLNAIGFCDRNRLYSASLIKDFLESKAPVQKSEQAEMKLSIILDTFISNKFQAAKLRLS